MGLMKASKLTVVHCDDTTTELTDVQYKLHSHGLYVEEPGKDSRNIPAHDIAQTTAVSPQHAS
jgi:hypothetical protein